MTRLISRIIYDMALGPAPVGGEADRRNRDARATAWHRHGLAVIDPADIQDDLERQTIINRANALYGRRNQGGQR